MSDQTAPGADSPAVILDWPIAEVARLTLNRGPALNTLTYELVAALDEAIDEARSGGARVMIVTGTGKVFCGGAHLKYFVGADAPLAHNPRAIRDDYVGPIVAVFRKLRDLPLVSIAAVNGHAFGGGCELALSCDFRLMTRTARIGLTETRLGALAAAGGVQLLARLVGRAKALEIALLGDQWSADQAAATGLINAVHEPDALEAAALALAQRLLLCSPVSVSETKRALDRCETASADEANLIALDAMAAAAAGPDWWEGMAAFVEKRPPHFAVSGVSGDGPGLGRTS